MIKSRDNLFALNYGRSDITVFAFHDRLPSRLVHAKVFKFKCKGILELSYKQSNPFQAPEKEMVSFQKLILLTVT